MKKKPASTETESSHLMLIQSDLDVVSWVGEQLLRLTLWDPCHLEGLRMRFRVNHNPSCSRSPRREDDDGMRLEMFCSSFQTRKITMMTLHWKRLSWVMKMREPKEMLKPLSCVAQESSYSSCCCHNSFDDDDCCSENEKCLYEYFCLFANDSRQHLRNVVLYWYLNEDRLPLEILE